MKKISTLMILLISAASAFSQSQIYTANKSSVWSDPTMWTITSRTDGVPKMKVVIPAGITVDVNNGVNAMGAAAVEIAVRGTMKILGNTTVNLAAGSTVELISGGAITGNTNTQIINIAGVRKYDGSLDFTKAGSFIANGATGVSPFGFVSTLVLPVNLVSFNATKSNNEVYLKWATASETSNDYFLVESSVDGTSFNAIGMVKGAVNTHAMTSYSYTHHNVNGTVIYYRLKQYDTKGTFSYSEVKKVNASAPAEAKIYRSAQSINVELADEVSGKTVVSVMNASGAVIARKSFEAGRKLVVNIEDSVKGIVFVTVNDNKQLNKSAKLML